MPLSSGLGRKDIRDLLREFSPSNRFDGRRHGRHQSPDEAVGTAAITRTIMPDAYSNTPSVTSDPLVASQIM